jgi:hypothetical protein
MLSLTQEQKTFENLNKEIQAKKTKETFSKAGDFIEAIKKELGLDIDFFVLSQIWDNEIGSNNAQIYGYKKNVVFAETDSATSMYDILARKKAIISKLNQYLGSNKIKSIKVRIKQ